MKPRLTRAQAIEVEDRLTRLEQLIDECHRDDVLRLTMLMREKYIKAIADAYELGVS